MLGRLLGAVVLGGELAALALPAVASAQGIATWYASTTGSGTACSAEGPCALATALSDADGSSGGATVYLTTSGSGGVHDGPSPAPSGGRSICSSSVQGRCS